jgi:hypothetical protein
MTDSNILMQIGILEPIEMRLHVESLRPYFGLQLYKTISHCCDSEAAILLPVCVHGLPCSDYSSALPTSASCNECTKG